MGVKKGYQGRNIGKLLGEAIIQKAKEKGGKELFLETNQRLIPAISLYKKLGFKEVIPDVPSVYERSNYRMELLIE